MSREIGCPDKPVSKISEDLFEVRSYVDGLCSFVRMCDTPMTISIQGDWGSGKTSMMNMMKENLEASIWPIWFNTWQFSQFNMGNSLVFSMMDVLLSGLDCEKSSIVKILGGIAKNVVRVATDRVAGGVVEGMVSDAMDGESNDFAGEVLALKQKFQEAVDKKLTKEHRDRVVVFVDDLDRLQPLKAIELLEVLKLFLDCDKCVFILAVDYEVVTLGIKEKFGENVSEEKGRSFFDKIIQLPFKMPVAQYDISKYVKDMMSKMSITPTNEDVALYTSLIKTSVGYNPRSMKRLFNTYQLLDIISNAAIANIDANVRKRILFAIVCAQMSFEEFYLYLASADIAKEELLDLTQKTDDITLKEFYPDYDEETVAKKSRKLSLFIPNFIKALKESGKEDLTDEEAATLKLILKCSTVTSVNVSADEQESGSDWDYRYKNNDLIKNAANLLKEIGEYKIWRPKQGNGFYKFYELSGYHDYTLPCGINIRLEYFLTRTDTSHIGVSIMITCYEKERFDYFMHILGDNPLKMQSKPIKYDNWNWCRRYKYENLLVLTDNDANSAEQIANIVKNAYKTLMDIKPE